MKSWVKGRVTCKFGFTELNAMQEDGSGYYSVWYSSQIIGPIYPVYQKDENGNNILDADGNKQYDYGAGRPSFTNMNWIAALEDDRRERKTYSFSGRTYFTISDKENDNLGFFKDFSVTANFGADYKNQNYLRYYNPFEGNASDIGGSGYREASTALSYTLNQLLNYNREFSFGEIDFLAGHEFYSLERQYLYAEKSGYAAGDLYELANAAKITDANSFVDNYRIQSVFGRLNYSFRDKYYDSGSYRRDGSSRFYADSSRGQFWSVRSSWSCSVESCMDAIISWLSSATLKAVYGLQDIVASVFSNAYKILYLR